MKNIKNAYYYIYYTIYKAAQSSSTIFSYHFVASLTLCVLELFLSSSLMFYYANSKIDISDNVFLIISFIIIFIPNYFILDYQDRYKKYIDKFDHLSKEKNIQYKIIVWVGIGLIIINLIYSVCYMAQQAEQNHTGPYSKEYIEQQKKKDSVDNLRLRNNYE